MVEWKCAGCGVLVWGGGGGSCLVDQASVIGKGFTAEKLEGEKKINCGRRVLA